MLWLTQYFFPPSYDQKTSVLSSQLFSISYSVMLCSSKVVKQDEYHLIFGIISTSVRTRYGTLHNNTKIGTVLIMCALTVLVRLMGLLAVLFQRHKLYNPKNVPHRESEGVRSFRWRGQGRKRGSAGWTRTRQVPLIDIIIRSYFGSGSGWLYHPGSGSKSFYGSDLTTGTAQIEK